jgi:outer membrane protein OmpA-like peptidoglycan-associated protein
VRRISLTLLAAATLAASPASACVTATIYFPWNSAEVSAEGRAEIERVARALAWKGPDLHQVLITSHTDTSGPAAVNRRIAERRAEAVRALLLTQEVPANLIEIRPLGEQGSAAALPPNVRDPRLRRVDLVIQLHAEAQERQIADGQPIC